MFGDYSNDRAISSIIQLINYALQFLLLLTNVIKCKTFFLVLFSLVISFPLFTLCYYFYYFPKYTIRLWERLSAYLYHFPLTASRNFQKKNWLQYFLLTNFLFFSLDKTVICRDAFCEGLYSESQYLFNFPINTFEYEG